MGNQQNFEIKNNWTESIEKFEQLLFKRGLLKGIKSQGLKKPSTIQQKSLAPIFEKRDFIIQAQPGKDKIETISICALQLVLEVQQNTQVLILVPTRELASQIVQSIKSLGQFQKVSVHQCQGRDQINEDKQALQSGVQVVVGTPSLIEDMINKGFLSTQHFRLAIIDQYNELIERGYDDYIKFILKKIKKETQLGVFLDNTPLEIQEVANKYMNNPFIILSEQQQLTLDGIKQFYVPLDKESKFQTFLEIYQRLEIQQCIIYCNDKNQINYLTNQLINNGIKVSSVGGSNMEQEKIDLILEDFKSGNTIALITTDQILDIIEFQHVQMVINYDIPKVKDYIKRIGWYNIGNRRKTAINFILPNDYKIVDELQFEYNTQINDIPQDITDIL